MGDGLLPNCHLRSAICCIKAMHDFLARPVLHEFRFRVAQIHGLTEQFHRLAQRSWRFGFHERAKFGGDFVHAVRAEAQGHAFVRTHRVDRDGKRRYDTIHRGFLDEQRLPTAGRFHFAVGEFGDFEFGGNGRRNFFQLTCALQRFQKITKGIESHAARLTKQVVRAMLRVAK